MCERVVVLIDMDCFYCQVEEILNPAYKGKPIAVVQYNAWRGGGIIAVNYPARAHGVTRGMRGEEAQQKCPDIVLPRVPSKNSKADTTRYRDAGKRVADVLQTFTPLLERASVDEAYLDITDNVDQWLKNDKEKVTKELLFNTFAVGHVDIAQFLESIFPEDESLANENSLKLAIGACIANKIRSAVLEKTGYECSAGIAHNKTLAKLVCGLNKPNKQTILPHDNIQDFYKTLPVTKIRSLGGKFGEHVCTSLNIKFMSELFPYTERQLQQKFGDKYGSWLYNIARGFDNEPVVQKLISKSIGCCKNFPGRNSIKNIESLKHWLHELADEVAERLQKDEIENSRRAKQLIVNFTLEINKQDVSNSRSTRLLSYDVDQIAEQSYDVITQSNLNIVDKNSPDIISLPIKHLGLHVGKFEGKNENGLNITSFFNKIDPNKIKHNEQLKNNMLVKTYSNDIHKNFSKSSNDDLENESNVQDMYIEEFNENFQQECEFVNLKNNDVSKLTKQIESAESLENLNQKNSRKQNKEIKSFFINNHEKIFKEKSFSKPTNELVKISAATSGNENVDSANDFSYKSSELNSTKLLRTDNCANKVLLNHSTDGIIETTCIEKAQDNNMDFPSSSFFLKSYQEDIQGLNNDSKYTRPTTPDIYKPSTSKIDLNLPQVNTSTVNSDDSYSSTTELENILKASETRNVYSENEQMKPTASNKIDQAALEMSDYEFALQLAQIEFGKGLQKCNECGKEVLDMVTHMDHHLAFKISQQQRNEFRMQQKQNCSPINPSKQNKILNKKRKKSHNGIESKEKKNKTIISFFNKNL